MANATTVNTIRPEEAAHFGKLAAQWWDPNGSSAMLHKLNPVRLSFLRDCVDAHFGTDPQSVRPLTGKRALDVGCGAGLLAEPLARMGAEVVALDAAAENIAAARSHAEGVGLSIDYRAGELGEQGLGQFDLVTAMEVIEHVTDKALFMGELARHVAPGGLLVLSTPNRTAQSRLLMVNFAERLGAIPPNTHHWEDFITPEEMGNLLLDCGFAMGQPTGIAWSVGKGLHLSDDLRLNYILSAKRA